MKRTILAGLTILALAIAATSPANATGSRARDAHRHHNDVTGKAFTPAPTTQANLTQRFKDSQAVNLNKLTPRFKAARERNLNN